MIDQELAELDYQRESLKLSLEIHRQVKRSLLLTRIGIFISIVNLMLNILIFSQL